MLAEVTPLFVTSGDLVADRRYQWAIASAQRGDLAAAAEILEQTVALAPRFATAWFALGAIRDRLGDRPGAIAAFRAASEADPEDYHGARLHLARLGAGEPHPAMSAAYIARLFDQQAPRFDATLREHLAYRGPELLRAAVIRACETLGRTPFFRRAVDLGCGTGLIGGAFRPHVSSLIGVDLSPGMIEIARRTGLYAHLHVADVVAFLSEERSASADLILAGDVFVYLADLAPVCRAVARVLAPGGLFAFTVEANEGAPYALRDTLRYAHSPDYVRATLVAAALTPRVLDRAFLRSEKGVPVPGLVAVARKDESGSERHVVSVNENHRD
jgi:predicted TPR repeat methyltransferase